MKRLTDSDKIDFLLTVIRSCPAKPNMAKVAQELGINIPAANMRLNALKKESEKRLQDAGNGAKVKASGTPIKKTSTPVKTGTPVKKSGTTPSKKRKCAAEEENEDDEEDYELTAQGLQEMEEYLAQVEEEQKRI